MKFNKLIPELSVSNFEKSLEFYTKILGFKVEYKREKFAFLSLQGNQIMIDGGNSNPDSPWYTGKLDHPRGRGIHFQIEVDDIQPLIESLKRDNYPIKSAPKNYWFKQDKILIGMKGFLVMDPDGYLLMLYQDIGSKKIK